MDEALNKFSKIEPNATQLVKLRGFSGLTIEEAARELGVSSRTAKRIWAYAKSWLRREMD